MHTAPGNPRRSPIQVPTRPGSAKHRRSDESGRNQGGRAVGQKIKRQPTQPTPTQPQQAGQNCRKSATREPRAGRTKWKPADQPETGATGRKAEGNGQTQGGTAKRPRQKQPKASRPGKTETRPLEQQEIRVEATRDPEEAHRTRENHPPKRKAKSHQSRNLQQERNTGTGPHACETQTPERKSSGQSRHHSRGSCQTPPPSRGEQRGPTRGPQQQTRTGKNPERRPDSTTAPAKNQQYPGSKQRETTKNGNPSRRPQPGEKPTPGSKGHRQHPRPGPANSRHRTSKETQQPAQRRQENPRSQETASKDRRTQQGRGKQPDTSAAGQAIRSTSKAEAKPHKKAQGRTNTGNPRPHQTPKQEPHRAQQGKNGATEAAERNHTIHRTSRQGQSEEQDPS